MNQHLVNKALTEDATQLPEFLQTQVEADRAILRDESNEYADRVDALVRLRSALYF